MPSATVGSGTEREMVLEYVVQRSIEAFREGDDEQAFSLNRMAEVLTDMNDDEYIANYPDGGGDIA